jgi:hypothetical protein
VCGAAAIPIYIYIIRSSIHDPTNHVAEEEQEVAVPKELEHALVAPRLPIEKQLGEGPHGLHDGGLSRVSTVLN